MGTPLLLSADHSFFIKERIFRHKRGAEMDKVRRQEARTLYLSLSFLSFFLFLFEPFRAAVLFLIPFFIVVLFFIA